jgi:NAD(P)-dependent dehydrogenase (short-subunit alcohol dehydrogenase family)
MSNNVKDATQRFAALGDEGRQRLAVVVGGAISIGEATCEVLAERGWRIVVADINRENGKKTAERLGGHAHWVDTTKPETVEAVAQEIEAAHGPVFAMVMCAAIFQPRRPIEETPLDEWERILRTNVYGTYLTNLAFGRRMAAHGEGAIVNLSSWNGIRTTPQHAYAASKAGVNMLTEGMAVEWGRSGVRVNGIMPGFVEVPRVAKQISDGKRYSGHPKDLSALGRIVQPREVGEAISFLISDRAAAITGVNLAVDTGTLVAPSWAMFGGSPAARPRGEATPLPEAANLRAYATR